MQLIKKSILASLLIACGVAVALTLDNSVSAILFAFGLFGVCMLDAYLFTGKVGYIWNKEPLKLLSILILNVIFGYIIGYLLSIANPSLIIVAQTKVHSWSFNLGYFFKSVFCGMIMYIAVEMFKQKNIFGILYGIPVFIISGFQHCIANAIIYGVANKFFTWPFILCILGNSLGSIICSILNTKDKE